MGRPPLPVGTFGKIGFLTLPNGQVRARVKVRDYDGVSRPVSRYGKTKAAAERALKEALRDRTGPTGEEISGDTRIRVVCEKWRIEIQSSDLAAGSIDTYTRTLDGYVLPSLGELLVREATVPRVDRFFKSVREHHGAGAAKNAKTVASLVLQLAVRHGALAANPVRDVAKVKRTSRKARPRALTSVEESDLLALIAAEAGSGAGDREGDELDLADIVELMLGTGCRIGEALAVRREVVDLENGVIEINATIIRITGVGAVLQERTKSDAGWRVIAVPDHVRELCRDRLNRAHPIEAPIKVLQPDGQVVTRSGNDVSLLFTSALGALRSPSNVQRGLRAVLNRIKGDWGWVVPHTFRRTVATRLDDAGLSARKIADHLGHAKPSMTQDLYMGRSVAAAEAAEALRR